MHGNNDNNNGKPRNSSISIRWMSCNHTGDLLSIPLMPVS